MSRVTDRPRQCGCGIPVLVTVDGRVVDDRPATRGLPHDCWWEWTDLGEAGA